LIIGGGFAGIAAARGLKVEIVKTVSRSLSSRCSPLLGSAARESVN
jgi:NADH dehydrogenase FAD-containing subunit